MSWQDWVLSIGGWIFIICLIPTIRGKQKPEISTSLTTAIVLYTFVATYLSLKLYLSSLAMFASASSWAILAYQRWKQPKQK